MPPLLPATGADLDHAASTIAAARRVLVTGLVGAAVADAVAACDLAEALAAAFDPGAPETARVTGPTVARIGGVTAVPAELRDRADLVVFWFCDPRRADATFLDRFVAPALPGPRGRRTIAVGPHDVAGDGAAHRHVALPGEAAIDAARLVEAAATGIDLETLAADGPLRSAADAVAAAVAAASCVAVVTDWAADPTGLGPWSTASLVRRLAGRRPAFEVPLGERDDAAVAVGTWRYGAAGAIEVADRAGGRFLPAEGDAVRLVDRREVDCVVVVGTPTPEVNAALARAGDAIAVVRLAPPLADVARRIAAARSATGTVA